MGREKSQEKDKEPRSSHYTDDEEEERASYEDYDIHIHTERTKPQDPPTRAQGLGHGASGKPVPKK
jgi:hypothetical protein